MFYSPSLHIRYSTSLSACLFLSTDSMCFCKNQGRTLQIPFLSYGFLHDNFTHSEIFFLYYCFNPVNHVYIYVQLFGLVLVYYCKIIKYPQAGNRLVDKQNVIKGPFRNIFSQ